MPTGCISIDGKPAGRIGKNYHAALTQNLQQPSACFLLRFPEYHRKFLPQDTLYHLVKVGIHGVDLPPTVLLLCLLLCLPLALAEENETELPELTENVEIEGIAVDEEDSVSELDA